jgi:hypothetical protein
VDEEYGWKPTESSIMDKVGAAERPTCTQGPFPRSHAKGQVKPFRLFLFLPLDKEHKPRGDLQISNLATLVLYITGRTTAWSC